MDCKGLRNAWFDQDLKSVMAKLRQSIQNATIKVWIGMSCLLKQWELKVYFFVRVLMKLEEVVKRFKFSRPGDFQLFDFGI